ncbi:MAG: hypothetical protein ABSC57_04265 [Syntrophales bacterium]|jgi:hypothetical protein
MPKEINPYVLPAAEPITKMITHTSNRKTGLEKNNPFLLRKAMEKNLNSSSHISNLGNILYESTLPLSILLR